MLTEQREKQSELEFVSVDDLVPGDHLLRKIDKTIDFDFIRDKVRDLYCTDNGRPSVDPVMLFRMLFIGYLHGIRSERQLVKDIQVIVAIWGSAHEVKTRQRLSPVIYGKASKSGWTSTD